MGGLSQNGALIQHPLIFGFVLQLCIQIGVSGMSHLKVSLKALQHDLSPPAADSLSRIPSPADQDIQTPNVYVLSEGCQVPN